MPILEAKKLTPGQKLKPASLLLTKNIHPDQTTEKEKQYQSALGDFLPERAAVFTPFSCCGECAWGDEWLGHRGRAAGARIPAAGGFCPLGIWITPGRTQKNKYKKNPNGALPTMVSFTDPSSNADPAQPEEQSPSNS